MPTYKVTDPNSGRVVRLTGDSPPSEQELNDIFSQLSPQAPKQQKQPEFRPQLGGFGAAGFPMPPAITAEEGKGVAEFTEGVPGALPTLASGAVAEPLAGAAGFIQEGKRALGFNGPSGADVVEATREALTIDPIGEKAQRTLQTIGETLEPVSGIPRAAGEAVQDITGSPEAATIVETALVGIPAAIGAKTIKTPKVSRIDTSGNIGIDTAKVLAEKTKQLGGDMAAKDVTPTKQVIFERIEAGDPDVDFLGKTVQDGKIVKTEGVRQAKKQGFDNLALRSIETASPRTKAEMRRMLNVLKRRRKDAEFKIENRTTDVVGENIYRRYKALNNLKKSKGKRVNEAAQDLQKESFDFTEPKQKLFDDLKDSGVKIVKDDDGLMQVDLSDVDFSHKAATKKVLEDVLDRFNRDQAKSAFHAHKIKTLVNDTVDFGKLPTADAKIAKGVENSLKRFTHSLNEQLRDISPDYAKANDGFRAVIEPLSQMDQLFKSILNSSSGDALTAAAGTKAARTVMSNNLSRGAMLNMLKTVEDALNSNKIRFKDDLKKQIVFVDEMERMFGSEATTSLGGSSQRATDMAIRGALGADIVTDAALKGVDALRGVNPDNAIKALEKILAEQSSRK